MNGVAEASQNYLEEKDSPAIPVGYKQTEVGILPDDWETPKFGDICTLINGRGFKPYEWSIEGLPIIRIQNLNGSDEFNYYQGHYDPKIFVKNGQLLFAWSGSRGTSFGPHIWHGEDALLNYHTWKLVIKNEAIDAGYFFHILKQLTKQIEEAAHGASALVHTQKGEMENFFVPLPKTRREQTAIANALSDVDSLISELEKLIAKKQAIKTATKQQLLTGRTRLPQLALREDGTKKGTKPSELGTIPEDWEVKKINDLADVIRGASPRPKGDKRYYGGNVPRLMVEDVTRDGKYVSPIVDSLTEAGAKLSRPCPAGTLTIVCSGTVGVPSILAVDACIHDGFLGLTKVSKTVNIDYLYHFFSTQREKFNSSATHGGVFTNLTTEGVREFQVALPDSSEEQSAIATILSDMDEEIQVLEQRQSKTRQIKQGMMQELLTGKTRLLDRKEAK